MYWETSKYRAIAAKAGRAKLVPPQWAVDAGLECRVCKWTPEFFEVDLPLMCKGKERMLTIILGLESATNYIASDKYFVRATFTDSMGTHVFVGNNPICFVMPLPNVIDSPYALDILKQELQSVLNGEEADWGKLYNEDEDEDEYEE